MSDLQKFSDSCTLLVLQVCAYPAHWVILAGFDSILSGGRGLDITTLSTETIQLNTKTNKMDMVSTDAEAWLGKAEQERRNLTSTLGNQEYQFIQYTWEPTQDLPELFGGICEESRVCAEQFREERKMGL